MTKEFKLTCPIPLSQYPTVLLAHGGGGKLMHDLIEKMMIPTFGGLQKSIMHDSAVVNVGNEKIAYTTDSYVVNPIFFPGGDIGSLAVYGTVNDLSMSGAKPFYISVGFIIEEGFPMESLWKIVRSINEAAGLSSVQIITGDTKVVDKGKGDGIYINTSGIGVIEHDLEINPTSVRNGDVIIINGDIGRHGIAIMSAREGLEFDSLVESDSAPLNKAVEELLMEGVEIHCMRDLTRGGLASALVEIAESSDLEINIEEQSIPVREDVRGACEILGFDPVYVANEGRFVIFVPQRDSDKTMEILRSHMEFSSSSVIGRVKNENRRLVTMKSRIGTERIVDMISGEQLPRIC